MIFVILFALVACKLSTIQPNGEIQVEMTQPNSKVNNAVVMEVEPVIPSEVPTENVKEYDVYCMRKALHPIGTSISQTYEVSYEQVIGWYCGGYSLEDILVALETGDAVDIPAEALLQMHLEKDWEEIWDELGFVKEP